MAKKIKLEPILMGIASAAFVLLMWYVIATWTPVSKIFPTPIEVGGYFFSSFIVPIGKYTLLQHIGFSMKRVLIGYAISSSLGIVVGIASGYSKMINAIVRPIFNLVRPIPGLAWIPLAILWFGIGETSKYFIIFMAGFAVTVVNCYDGATEVNQNLVGAAELLGANKLQIFWHIIIPSAVPHIFTGLQVSLSSSWMTVLAAEMVSSNMGCGWIITMGMQSGNTVMELTGMIAIAVVGFGLEKVMEELERRLCVWRIRGN